MREPIADVQLAPDAAVEHLGNEIGQLSVLVVQSKLKLAAALLELNRVLLENDGLRVRIVARDADVLALRAEVVAKRKK